MTRGHVRTVETLKGSNPSQIGFDALKSISVLWLPGPSLHKAPQSGGGERGWACSSCSGRGYGPSMHTTSWAPRAPSFPGCRCPAGGRDGVTPRRGRRCRFHRGQELALQPQDPPSGRKAQKQAQSPRREVQIQSG